MEATSQYLNRLEQADTFNAAEYSRVMSEMADAANPARVDARRMQEIKALREGLAAARKTFLSWRKSLKDGLPEHLHGIAKVQLKNSIAYRKAVMSKLAGV